jgi:uncharacterized protein
MAATNDTARAGQNARNHIEDADVSSSVPDSLPVGALLAAPSPEFDPFAHRGGSSATRSSLAAQAIMASITGYQKFLSPLKAQPTCRFYPTCSQYALDAVSEHGAVVGSWLAVKRISKCHPLHPGGLDPVPPARVRRSQNAPIRLLEDR